MKKKCEFCEGSGWEVYEDPKTDGPTPVLCKECGGFGYIELEEEDCGTEQGVFRAFV